jgi:hypothetical protein
MNFNTHCFYTTPIQHSCPFITCIHCAFRLNEPRENKQLWIWQYFLVTMQYWNYSSLGSGENKQTSKFRAKARCREASSGHWHKPFEIISQKNFKNYTTFNLWICPLSALYLRQNKLWSYFNQTFKPCCLHYLVKLAVFILALPQGVPLWVMIEIILYLF